MNAIALTSALSLLLEQQSRENQQVKPEAKVIPMLPAKLRAMKQEQQAKPATTIAPTLALPKPGTLSASQFLHANNHAGVRKVITEKGTIERTFPQDKRDELIRAIAGYIGSGIPEVVNGKATGKFLPYSSSDDFGPQYYRALFHARQATTKPRNPLCLSVVKHGEVGAIFGAANHRQKQLDNLMGRHEYTLDMIAEYSLLCQDPSKSPEERLQLEGLMMVEQERLRHIERDIQLFSAH